MIVCPACKYPNDEQDYRCERCGRRFDAPLLTQQDGDDDGYFDQEAEAYGATDFGQQAAGDDLPPWEDEPAPVELAAPAPAVEEAPPAPVAESKSNTSKPLPPEWKGQIPDRVRRFRELRAAQCSLPFDDNERSPQSESRPSESRIEASPAAMRNEPGIRRHEEPEDNVANVIRFEEIAARAAARISPAPVPRPLASAQPEPVVAPAAVSTESEVQPPAVAPPQPSDAAATQPPAEPKRATAQAAPQRRARARARDQQTPAVQHATPPADPMLAFPEPRPRETRRLAAQSDDCPLEVEVAPLAARAIAGAYDAGVLAAGIILFFAAYAITGGRFPLQRAALAGIAVAGALVAGVFLWFCLVFSDATPGLRWLGIRLVDFEGGPAPRERRILRLAGMITSALALGLGYFWAIADEEGLTWHDRISRTCLTMSGSRMIRRPHNT